MEAKPRKRAWRVAFIPFLVFFFTACSLLSWLKSENRAYRKMKERTLADQEVVVIDGQEYVKIAVSGNQGNPSGSRYRYIAVDEYLSKEGEFPGSKGQDLAGEEPLLQSETKTITQSHDLSITASREMTEIPASSSIELRRKIVIAPFEEGEPDENWGEMVAQRLRNSMESRTERILCLDGQVILDYLNRSGMGSIPFNDPIILRIANTVFGVHALFYGTLSGPYVVASTGKGGDGDDTAMAIVRIQGKLVEAATGRVMKVFEKRNPIFATEERGEFCRDKAKRKAIQVAIKELTGDILHGMNQMGWYTRIVKIDGDRVYLNAGRLTGLKVGDLMDVYEPGGDTIEQMIGISLDPFKGQRKGQLRVSQLFGTDAAIAHITNGGNFALSDVARPSTY
jgi:hypothetical protein